MHTLMTSIERSGARIPGYNMKAYPKGDPRARKLLEAAERVGGKPHRIHELVSSVEEKFDLKPSIEVGLVALCMALELPVRSASTLWTMGRVAGFIAHVVEQRQAGFMMRPRARYIGPAPVY
jgi:citrate synthase